MAQKQYEERVSRNKRNHAETCSGTTKERGGRIEVIHGNGWLGTRKYKKFVARNKETMITENIRARKHKKQWRWNHKIDAVNGSEPVNEERVSRNKRNNAGTCSGTNKERGWAIEVIHRNGWLGTRKTKKCVTRNKENMMNESIRTRKNKKW